MDKLLFGDNQFFGINHMSEEKARAQAMRFQKTDAIMSVLDTAYDAGIKTFMCTTHDRISEVADRVRADPDRYSDFTFYPCMPYAHKYANAVTDHGMVGALRAFMPQDGLLSTALSGAKAMATKEIDGVAKVLIDMEMRMFQRVNAPVVFVQNVFTDLLLGMGFTRALKIFDDHIREKYNAEPAYITMNMPMLLDALEKEGIERPIICSNINKLGFRMSGGFDAYLDALKSGRVRAVAMSVYASGAIPADEAIHWISELPGVESIVFGASSAANIHGTKALVDKYIGDACEMTREIATDQHPTLGALRRVPMLNAYVHDVGMDNLVANFTEGTMLTLHVDMIMKLQQDRDFYDIIDKFDVITCDSQIMYFATKFLKTPVQQRVSGSDYFPKFYMHHKDNPEITVFLSGGKPGVAQKAAKNINAKVGRDIIVGTDSPAFDFDQNPDEIARMIDAINASGATVCLVGLAGGRQEKFIMKYRDRMPGIKLWLPLGGTIDYESGGFERPPKWITEGGFEWLYRLIKEPRARFHRYVIHEPPFLWAILKQKLGIYRNPFRK